MLTATLLLLPINFSCSQDRSYITKLGRVRNPVTRVANNVVEPLEQLPHENLHTKYIAQDHYSDSYGPLRNKQRGYDGEKRKGLRDLTVAFDPTVSYIEPSRK